MAKNKPRNEWTVVTLGKANGRTVFETLPAVSTEGKAREVLEGLGVHGFVKHSGETVLQYSPALAHMPARWIDRS